MNNFRHLPLRAHPRPGHSGERGVAAVEMAIILPVMLVTLFALIDFGLLFNARFVITNLAREGASLGSRDIQSAANLIGLLQAGAGPLDLEQSGRIYIRRIRAGATRQNPYPAIDYGLSAQGGALSVPSSTGSSAFGLSSALYSRLVFEASQNTSDIGEVTVVEVFYKYTPITPLANFIPGLLTDDGGGKIIGSRAVF
jgi:hypothetical protein